MKSNMVWVCVVENPSREQESMVIDVIERVERSTVESRFVGRDGMELEVHIPDAGVAREVFDGFVSYRDRESGSKREYSEFDSVVEGFVQGLEESELDVELSE